MIVLAANLESDIIDPHYFSPVHINDLLVQQVPQDPQHVLIIVIGGEDFVVEANACEGGGLNLIMADAEPRLSGADQVTIHPERVNERHDGAVADAADSPPLEVIDRQAQ